MTVKLFRNARIYTPEGSEPSTGAKQGEVRLFEGGALLVDCGLIAAIGPESIVLAHPAGKLIEEEVDCEGRCVIPGFVDPHPHMCFAARREGSSR